MTGSFWSSTLESEKAMMPQTPSVSSKMKRRLIAPRNQSWNESSMGNVDDEWRDNYYQEFISQLPPTAKPKQEVVFDEEQCPSSYCAHSLTRSEMETAMFPLTNSFSAKIDHNHPTKAIIENGDTMAREIATEHKEPNAKERHCGYGDVSRSSPDTVFDLPPIWFLDDDDDIDALSVPHTPKLLLSLPTSDPGPSLEASEWFSPIVVSETVEPNVVVTDADDSTHESPTTYDSFSFFLDVMSSRCHSLFSPIQNSS